MSSTGRQKLKPVQPRESLEQRMSKFIRQRDAVGVDWRQVEVVSLRGALLACMSAGAALMFSGANGGRGVCVTIFADNDKVKEYAVDAGELNLLLEGVIDAFQGTSEDVRQAVV